MKPVILLAMAGVFFLLAILRTCSYLHKQKKRKKQRRRVVRKGTDGLAVFLFIVGFLLLAVGFLLPRFPGFAPPAPTGSEPQSSTPGATESSPSTTAPPQTTGHAPATLPPETTAPAPLTGWQEIDGNRFFFYEDGTMATGWLEEDGKRYYLDESGILQTGWIETDGLARYLLPDGSMATGRVEIDGTTHFFTSQGLPIYLVNPWNPVPQGQTPDLVSLSSAYGTEGCRVDQSCYEALKKMMDDCEREAHSVCVVSGYRSYEYQEGLFQRKINYFLDKGYSEADARAEAATIVAVPGTSEHQLGLAVDIVDTSLWVLDERQAQLEGQQWLMENSWRYGFILRYPEGTTEITGIIYEPWHYRYVGPEVAAELHESGMLLEEYIGSLTAPVS